MPPKKSTKRPTSSSSSSYNPASEGFAKYFLSMLDDTDRNVSYSLAIKAAIADFVMANSRPPRVLDIGIGTGMLSSLCLLHGASHVTGVDTNRTMVSLSTQNLSLLDPTRTKFTVLLVDPGPSQIPPDTIFDMFVSEILGTLTTSESMYKYLSIYSHHLRKFGGDKVYCVPSSTRQFFSLRSFPLLTMPPPVASAIRVALADPESFDANGSRLLIPTNEGGIGLHLQLYPSTLLPDTTRMTIHEEKYTCLENLENGGVSFPYTSGNTVDSPPMSLTPLALSELSSPESLTLGVFEWEVELWPGSPLLLNTLSGLSSLPLRNQLARGAAWGLFVSSVPEPTIQVQVQVQDQDQVQVQVQGGAKKVQGGGKYVVRSKALNPRFKTTPTVTVKEEGVGGNVSDLSLPFVSVAGDTELARRIVLALEKVVKGRDGYGYGYGYGDGDGDGDGDGVVRVLIVDDVTCGGIVLEANSRGIRANYDVVSSDPNCTTAGILANQSQNQSQNLSQNLLGLGKNGQKQNGQNVNWVTGTVDVGGTGGRRTRSVFVPDPLPDQNSGAGGGKYDVVLFPMALLLYSRAGEGDLVSEVTLGKYGGIADAHLRSKEEGGRTLPRLGSLRSVERKHRFKGASVGENSVPREYAKELKRCGVEGALDATGKLRGEGGVLVGSGDKFEGVLWTGVHCVEEAGGGEEEEEEEDVIEAGIIGVRGELFDEEDLLEWDVGTWRYMVREGGGREEKNSAVSRAVYQGVRMRVDRQEKKGGKKKVKRNDTTTKELD